MASIRDYRGTGLHYKKKCEHCGSTFYPKNHRAKYCSLSCKALAYHKRKSDKGESRLHTQEQIDPIPKSKVCDFCGKKHLSGQIGKVAEKGSEDNPKDCCFTCFHANRNNLDFLYLQAQGGSRYYRIKGEKTIDRWLNPSNE